MKRILRILLLTLAHALLVALIVLLILANWMPAIYTSNWFRTLFPPP